MPDGGGADERSGARGMGDNDRRSRNEQRVRGQGGELSEEKKERHEMDREACAPAEEASDLLLPPVRLDPGPWSTGKCRECILQEKSWIYTAFLVDGIDGVDENIVGVIIIILTKAAAQDRKSHV